MPGGRPTDYNSDLAAKICERLVLGESLRSICRDADMPAICTIFVWLGVHPEFKEQYAHARESQADTLADELLDICDDSSNDWMDRRNKDGEVIGKQVDQEAINRSRLRVDTRKWIASKLKPKRYADKVDVEHTGGMTINVITGVPQK